MKTASKSAVVTEVNRRDVIKCSLNNAYDASSSGKGIKPGVSFVAVTGLLLLAHQAWPKKDKACTDQADKSTRQINYRRCLLLNQ